MSQRDMASAAGGFFIAHAVGAIGFGEIPAI